jgi:hypothetical protein
MQNRLYLHCGAHKTGTTTIQLFLKKNASQLQSCGYHFIFVQSYLHSIPAPSIEQPFCIVDRLDLKSLCCDVKAALSSCSVVLSFEGFSGSLHLGYADSSMAASIIFEIFSKFSPSIIIFLRNPIDFLDSAYCQAIKEGHAISADYYVNLFGDPFRAVLAPYVAYRHVFGDQRLHVISYEAACSSEGGIVGAFLGALSVLASARPLFELPLYSANSGYSRIALEIMIKALSSGRGSLAVDIQRDIRKLVNSYPSARKKYPYYILPPAGYQGLVGEMSSFLESVQSSSFPLAAMVEAWLSSFDSYSDYSTKYQAVASMCICVRRLYDLVRTERSELLVASAASSCLQERHHPYQALIRGLENTISTSLQPSYQG